MWECCNMSWEWGRCHTVPAVIQVCHLSPLCLWLSRVWCHLSGPSLTYCDYSIFIVFTSLIVNKCGRLSPLTLKGFIDIHTRGLLNEVSYWLKHMSQNLRLEKIWLVPVVMSHNFWTILIPEEDIFTMKIGGFYISLWSPFPRITYFKTFYLLCLCKCWFHCRKCLILPLGCCALEIPKLDRQIKEVEKTGALTS